MFVRMTLACLIGMGSCMFGLTTADGCSLTSLVLLVWVTTEILQSLKPKEREREYHPRQTCFERNDSVKLIETDVCF